MRPDLDIRKYKLFSPGRIGTLDVPNRLVRSATWDPCMLYNRKMTDEVLDLYQQLARGGVGLIVSGPLPVAEENMLNHAEQSYASMQIEGLVKMAEIVHAAGTDCKIVAQIETTYAGASGSTIRTPYFSGTSQPLSIAEIHQTITFFVQAIVHMRDIGFDGVQIQAAHGSLLCNFHSPYTNKRQDEYGGSLHNRVRFVREIVSAARAEVGDFPILIKVNSSDCVQGGIDFDNFPALACELEATGLDAIELSGGMWDCLVRSEAALGFPPLPNPEAHTHIQRPEKQSYFLEYAERLQLQIPVILVGGNRNVERLEAILQEGYVDFISLCRPLINEPDLPHRWFAGTGGKKSHCISCNSCLYEMLVHPGRADPPPVRCVFRENKGLHQAAQEWLSTWVALNTIRPYAEE